MTARQVDRAIEALARRQHGVFCRRQALALGASTSLIGRRLATGTWLRLASSVYALPGNPPTFERQCMAAVLSESVAWVSGATAAVLHGLDGFRPARIEITVPRGANHRNQLAKVHRADGFDATRISGIPAGTVEQTIVDLATRLQTSELEDLIDLAVAQRQTSFVRLARRFEASPPGRRRSLGALALALKTRTGESFVPATSKLEAALYRVLDDPSLPTYERQTSFPWRPTAPQRLDAYLPSWQLVVEGDGRAWHTRVSDFERDRRRDRDALANGFRTARFVYDELVTQPRSVVAELVQIGEALSGRGIRA